MQIFQPSITLISNLCVYFIEKQVKLIERYLNHCVNQNHN